MTEQTDLHQPVMTIARQDMVTLYEDYTIQQALDYIRINGFGEKIVYFYVVNGNGQLKGVILTRRLLTAPLEQLISEVMIRRLVTIPHDANILDAFDLLAHHKLLALPVVDPQQNILGVVYASMFMDENYIIDLVQRKKESLEIERLHRRLRSILDHMRELVLSFSYLEDFDTDKITDFSFFDDHLVEINSSALPFYEVPASYILYKKISVFDFIHDLDKDQVFAHYIGLFDKGFSEITYRIVTQRGQIKWVSDYGRVEYMKTGKVRRVNHIIEDITEKKKALDELQANEQKYRRIFELSKDMVYILKPNGQIIDINPAGIKLLGLSSKEDAMQRNIMDFHVDPTAGESLVKEILEKGEATKYRILFQNVRGEKFEIGLNAIAQRDDIGNAISYQGVAHNITEAIRQKELETIGQMAGCFADDLASPLNVVMIGVDTFKDFLRELENSTEKLSNQAATTDQEEINKITSQFADVNYFMNQVTIAINDIRQRLKETREQYWNLKKVSDGSGGIIFQRSTKYPL
ncbi:MAG: PAS domain S-box protein [Desulfobacteraceae bacterium]|nr:MAG: PAS domain S-box protein [Desulfobacteraceae bacterium]